MRKVNAIYKTSSKLDFILMLQKNKIDRPQEVKNAHVVVNLFKINFLVCY